MRKTELHGDSMVKLANQIIREANPPCRVIIDPSGRTFRAVILTGAEKPHGLEPWVIIDLEDVPTVDELVDAVVDQLVLAYQDKCSECDRVPQWL
jgi:hypothetical protein